jgi:hypothetical protein
VTTAPFTITEALEMLLTDPAGYNAAVLSPSTSRDDSEISDIPAYDIVSFCLNLCSLRWQALIVTDESFS